MAGLLLSATASADPYTDHLVGKFGNGIHVVVDPAANPPLANVATLNARIVQTKEPIYVAVVAPAQAGVTTPDSLYAAMLRAHGRFEGVLVVMDSGFHVAAFNVPPAVANDVGPFMAQAIAAHRNDPAATLYAFVGALANVHPTLSTPAGAAAPGAQKTSWTWLWITLTVLAVVALFVGMCFWFRAHHRSQLVKQRERNEVDDLLITTRADANYLADAVVRGSSNVDVSTEQGQVAVALKEADYAFERRDYAKARSQLKVARAGIDSANRKLKSPFIPPSTIDDLMDRHLSRNAGVRTVSENRSEVKFAGLPTTGVAETPGQHRQGTVHTVNPATGTTVVINNSDYRTTSTPGYGHYYGGGYVNGMMFYPGYYQYPFWGAGWGWSPLDVMLEQEILADQWGGNYPAGSGFSGTEFNSGFDGDSTAASEVDGWDNDTTFAGADTTTNVGFDGGDITPTTSQESDYGFDAPDQSQTYTQSDDSSSTYDSTPAYTSDDSGGGGGWGDSGGGDSGSWGGDSGSSGSDGW
ncbi:hypothetical protein [Mycolicibacterium sphagni]|uniref:hypothetical protein n=1 Tax=Mycolicibacterium sphagni TaxID=1786 RepID=UPI0021F388A8|nr:hypothetical protein [Mycolicibacterium sphagni]MCV7174777.1 hypothetical protein [Mycolicibacterium sphagni]